MLSIPELGAAIDEHAAIRRIRRMQPAGGVGDKLFPPTYPPEREGPPRHVFERRRLDDREVWCVLIDSVQSQANRMEEALLAAAAEQAIPLPYVTVDFREAGLQPLEQITSLDAPHRVYDAIIRDSLLDDVPFMESEQGRRLAAATPAAATALLEISPSALLFGAWHACTRKTAVSCAGACSFHGHRRCSRRSHSAQIMRMPFEASSPRTRNSASSGVQSSNEKRMLLVIVAPETGASVSVPIPRRLSNAPAVLNCCFAT